MPGGDLLQLPAGFLLVLLLGMRHLYQFDLLYILCQLLLLSHPLELLLDLRVSGPPLLFLRLPGKRKQSKLHYLLRRVFPGPRKHELPQLQPLPAQLCSMLDPHLLLRLHQSFVHLDSKQFILCAVLVFD